MVVAVAEAVPATIPRGAPIILYDGVCGFCNGTVRFILRRDQAGLFRFAPLQSEFARMTLARHDRDPSQLDTMYVIVDHGEASERVLAKSDGVIHILQSLGGLWGIGSGAGRLCPAWLRNRMYDVLARHRYRLFGKHDTCPLPDPAVRARFLG